MVYIDHVSLFWIAAAWVHLSVRAVWRQNASKRCSD